MGIKYFDSHSHLNFAQYNDDRDEVIARMENEGVATICVGVDLKTSKESVELATKHENIFAIIGVHPSDCKEGFSEEAYSELVENRKVVGIGECGLDYYRLENGITDLKSQQIRVFEGQIEFALKNDFPLMLHIRPSKSSMDAYEDALAILKSYNADHGSKLRGTSHFFAGNTEIASRFLEMGLCISFAGPVTFAKEYEEIVRYVPLDRILAETDAPFASPVPHRGKRNEPTFVKYVVETIAKIKERSPEEARRTLVDNALRVFIR